MKVQKRLIKYFSEEGIVRPDIHILAQIVFESWDEMKVEEREAEKNGDPTLVQKLYQSMPKRVKQIHERGGMHSDY